MTSLRRPDSAVPANLLLLSHLVSPHDRESACGLGRTVAILDGGVADHMAFETRLTRLDSAGLQDSAPPSEHATRCGSLVCSSHPASLGIAPRAHLISLNVSTHHRVDHQKVLSALHWLQQHPVDVVSASFVLEEPCHDVIGATETLIDAGTVLVGAAANSPKRQTFPWIRTVPGAVRVFADAVPTAAADQTEVFAAVAPGAGHSVVTATGDVVRSWRGQSSGATALVAGLFARLLSDGLSATEALELVTQ